MPRKSFKKRRIHPFEIELTHHRFVETIMNVTATMAIRMPKTIFVVSASPKTRVPTRIAVIGSNTPSTEAFVAPILRVETASVAVETTVGRMARPIRFPHAAMPSMPVSKSVSASRILPRKMHAPVSRD